MLESENTHLKEELKQVYLELESMREENMDLKKKLKDPSTKVRVTQSESTFVTGGSENLTMRCDNW